MTFRNRLALALLAPSEREPTGDETAADDDDAEERETGVRKRVTSAAAVAVLPSVVAETFTPLTLVAY